VPCRAVPCRAVPCRAVSKSMSSPRWRGRRSATACSLWPDPPPESSPLFSVKVFRAWWASPPPSPAARFARHVDFRAFPPRFPRNFPNFPISSSFFLRAVQGLLSQPSSKSDSQLGLPRRFSPNICFLLDFPEISPKFPRNYFFFFLRAVQGLAQPFFLQVGQLLAHRLGYRFGREEAASLLFLQGQGEQGNAGRPHRRWYRFGGRGWWRCRCRCRWWVHSPRTFWGGGRRSSGRRSGPGETWCDGYVLCADRPFTFGTYVFY